MKKKVEKKKITWKKYIGIVLFTITFIMVALSTWNVIQLDTTQFSNDCILEKEKSYINCYRNYSNDSFKQY